MKVKNFAGFMKTRKMNESDDMKYSDELDGMGMGNDEFSDDEEAGFYGANPEDEEEPEEGAEEGEEGEEKELTLEDLKAMIDDLTERVKKLEPEEEEEPEEGEEGEEPAEGETAPPASKV
jgi:hypothetical protein